MKLSVLLLVALSLLTHALHLEAADEKKGTVIDTIDAGNYTYIRIEESDVWIATPTLAASIGDQVSYSGGMEMTDFYSKTLDRTFESIYFIQNVKLENKNSIHQESVDGHKFQNSQVLKPDSITNPVPGEIQPFEDGKTIEEILASSDDLEGQTIKLRALVTKVNMEIMGKNWITLQDGGGSNPDQKLLATSAELVSPGDVVIANGIIKNDIDIGSGYKYEVLLEEATFSKE